MLLAFTARGGFLLQIGGPDRSKGNTDTTSVNKPADAYVDPETNELYVAYGYGNRRVIVFDAATGAFKRMWGAFGNKPIDAPAASAGATAAPAGRRGTGASPAAATGVESGGGSAPLETTGPGPDQFGSPVHNVKVSRDGLVYVADRANRRVQLFTREGKYLTQLFVNRAGPSAGSVAGIAFSPDSEQRFMYLADYGNSRIVVVLRETLDVLYQFGGLGEKPGEFRGPHHLAVDSRGNIYTAEVSPGNRAQRFVFKGSSTDMPANALKLP
jgi:DNA-binding beta-propeller fold protein YncE